jgi:Gamma-glutamyl cyclotransferase, AIG2-like
MERRIDMFFYGVFMDEETLRARGFDPANARLARVDGFALRIGDQAVMVPEPGAFVYGVVMSFTHKDLDRLYSAPNAAAYRVEPVLARTGDGGGAAALCFNLPDGTDDAAPNKDYTAKLRTIAQKVGLPKDYIAGIGRTEAAA